MSRDFGAIAFKNDAGVDVKWQSFVSPWSLHRKHLQRHNAEAVYVARRGNTPCVEHLFTRVGSKPHEDGEGKEVGNNEFLLCFDCCRWSGFDGISDRAFYRDDEARTKSNAL